MPRSSQEAEQFLPDLPACPDEVIHRVCQEFHENNPEIRIGEELECGPVHVRLHEMWFERILKHLLHNASRAVAVRNDPVIAIKTRQMRNDIRVDVVDNGHGISAGVLPLLFREPTPASEERSGQGLMIVRYLLELHGGQIQVGWNKPGQGTSIYFTIPVMSPARDNETKEHR
jgi:signal transduction histidine kinase